MRWNGRDVVRSMERIYAVPSEKLRVWSIWLTNIGEIADEWQKWLRAHIDFVIRLAEELQKADEALKQEEVSFVPCNDLFQVRPILDIYVKVRWDRGRWKMDAITRNGDSIPKFIHSYLQWKYNRPWKYTFYMHYLSTLLILFINWIPHIRIKIQKPLFPLRYLTLFNIYSTQISTLWSISNSNLTSLPI